MNKHGLYSKAAQIIRSLPQEKGTAEQMIGAAKKLGIKQVEIDNAKPPTGPITREALAKHFEDAIPNLGVTQYGENPRYTTRDDERRGSELISRDQLSPEEEVEYNRIRQRRTSRPNVETSRYESDDDYLDTADTQYGDYTIPDGRYYRERLLRLERPTGKPAEHYEVHTSHPDYARFGQYETLDEAQLAADEFYDRHGGDYNTTTVKRRNPDTGSYRSSHWSDHPNVLAHIRMSDRMVGEDRETVRPIAQKLADHFKVGIRDLGSYAADQGVKDGVVSPEEAASFARVMNFPFSKHHSAPGIGKRLLHVEELQSDWGQEGRDKGFSDPENPYEVFNKKTKEVLSRHPSYSEAWDAYRAIPEDQSADIDTAKSVGPPTAPYVQNTQHWTDLALKNVLREAALGNYDGVVFTPGQAQADRYGLEKQVSGLQLIRDPNASSFGTLNAWDNDGRRAFSEQVKDENHLGSLIGKEVAQKLLSSEKRGGDAAFGQDPSVYSHNLAGEDLKVGGEGMKGYYDNIVPKSVMALAKQHDPSAKPGEPITLQSNDGDYQGFHLPMTEAMKNSILDKGFSAFKRGGSVDAALALTRRFTKR
jgi:hypothetical protein